MRREIHNIDEIVGMMEAHEIREVFEKYELLERSKYTQIFIFIHDFEREHRVLMANELVIDIINHFVEGVLHKIFTEKSRERTIDRILGCKRMRERKTKNKKI